VLAEKQIAFIGGGVMGEAMIKGLLRQELVVPAQVMVSDPLSERCRALVERYQVNVIAENTGAVAGRDVVVLSIKPQIMSMVLPELAGKIEPNAVVISIAAGIPLRMLTDSLAHPSVVRAMPNTPGQIGEGITVWKATDGVSEEQLQQTQAVLGAMGETVQVDDERYLDMATALSGTGPAYVLLVMEAMIDAGVHLGFSRRIAEKLVMQTMRGTVEYARQSPRHPATLRNEVTSPGGTSAEAIYQLEKGGLRTVISRAIWAAYQRSVALGGGSDQPRLAGRSPENG
jgi:pyrroline-5-carboxylate reductase